MINDELIKHALKTLGFDSINQWKESEKLIPLDNVLYPAERVILAYQYLNARPMGKLKFSKVIPFKEQVRLKSPNFSTRKVDDFLFIVLHSTAGSDKGAESWMCNPKAKASAHFHIRRDGTIVRLVDDNKQAWHAGKSSWKGYNLINQYSLGIEIGNMNDGKEKYTEAQYKSVKKILDHYKMQGDVEVVTHAQISPGRKNDPLGFDLTKVK